MIGIVRPDAPSVDVGWLLVSGLVRPMFVAVPSIYDKDLSCVSRIEDQYVVPDFAAYGLDSAFAVCIQCVVLGARC